MLKRTLFSLLLGIIIVFFSHDDQWIKNVVSSRAQHLFEKIFHCNVDWEIVSLDFFHPRVVVRNVVVSSASESDVKWHWNCDHMVSRCTWRSIFFQRRIDIRIAANNLNVASALTNGTPDILTPIKIIMGRVPGGLPICLESVELHNATCTMSNQQKTLTFFVSFDSEAKRVDNLLCSHVWINTSSAQLYDRVCWDNFSGIVTCNKTLNGFYIDTDCTCDIPQLDELGKDCRVKGKLHPNRGSFFIESADKTLSINPISMSVIDKKIIVACSAQFPFSYLSHLMFNDAYTIGSSGTCYLKTIANVSDLNQGFNGHIDIQHMQFGRGLSDAACKIHFSQRKKKWKGAVHLHFMPAVEMNGTWNWDQTNNQGAMNITNKMLIEVPGTRYWSIKPHECTINLSADNQLGISGAYRGIVCNTKLDQQVTVTGSLQEKNKTLYVEGVVGDTTYKIDYILQPFVCFKTFLLQSKKGKPLGLITRKGNALTGSIEIPLIRSLVKRLLHYDIQGEGRFALSGYLEDKQLLGSITLVDGTVRVPQTYNFVHDFCATFALDYVKKKAVIKDVLCVLHKGSIVCKRAVTYFNDQLVPSFIHAPFIMNSCLFNVQKDLFAVISGSLLCTYAPKNNIHIAGQLIIERSQLKQNLFSQNVQKKLFTMTNELFTSNDTPLACDIIVKTRNPIQVKTSILETTANMHIALLNTINEQHITRSFNLV